MEIERQYLQKYLHDIALDQLMADYQAKGYQVSKDERIGSQQADLVAKKGDEVVVVEVRAGKMTPQKRRQVTEIGDFVRTHKNHKFLVVLATPPKPKKIAIPNLDHLLRDYLIENVPNNLTRLSSHTRITAIPDVAVNEVVVKEDGSIVAHGSGTIEVELHDGSTNDGTMGEDVFPLTFEVVLKYNQKQELFLAEAKNIDVDVSSFYE